MGWAGHVARMVEERKNKKFLMNKSENENSTWTP